MKILVTGLENSCTKIVSKIFSDNLKINGHEEYDGVMRISDDENLVSHMSLPSGNRTFFYIPKIKDWDIIIIATRDYNCSLKSKINIHQPIVKNAIEEHDYGRNILSQMIKFDNVYVFSYESWFLLGDLYVKKFLNQFDISYSKKTSPENVNKKYMKDS